MKTIKIGNLESIEKAAEEFKTLTQGYKKFAFYGPMGSGKTTFIKVVCKVLGANDVVTSPTFALVNEYRTARGEVFFHFDLYRINKTEELFDLGYEEYFYSDSYCFIEWPEKAEELLPPGTLKVHIEITGSNSRDLQLEL